MEKCRFPNRLKNFRRLFFFSQKEVALILGLKDTSQLSRWEKGVTLPSILNLFRLAKLYKVLPNEMYIDIWKSISLEVNAKEQNLLAPKEPLTINQVK